MRRENKRKVSRLILLTLLTFNMALFQNCSAGFEAQKSLGLSQSSVFPPEIRLIGAQELYNTPNIAFNFETRVGDADAISSMMCQLDDGSAQNCLSGSITYPSLADGDYTLLIAVQTQGGMTTQLRRPFRKDTTPPDLRFDPIPAATTSTSTQFGFTATDNRSGLASVVCSLDNSDLSAFNACTSPHPLTNLPAGTHTFYVRAADNAGNVAMISHMWNVTTSTPPPPPPPPPVVDTSVPTTPTGLAATATSTSQINLSWTASTDNVGVVGYRIYRCQGAGCTPSTEVASNNQTSFQNTGLSASTVYIYSVAAYDAAGNLSSRSANAMATTQTVVTPPPPPPTGGGLRVDLSYVDVSSSQFQRFKTMVDAALAGNPDYGFEPQHAAYMYRIASANPGVDANPARYCDYAITFAENCAGSRYAEANCGVQGAESVIASGGRPPVSGDSYLEVGPIIGSLAITYDWCASRMTAAQRTRWETYANQAIYNVWNPNSATWGGRSYPWSGWSIDNPGNNYYYSFVEATMYWALATRNSTLLNTVRTDKLQALVNYYANIPGGGSLEGTGYGAAHMRLFQIYQVWKDSTGEDLANLNSHMRDSIRFWVHATTPNRSYYAPVGDLARSSFPDLFDYHRRIVLEARRLTLDSTLQNLASWWLSHISVTQMSRRIDGQWDLLPAGTNADAAPAEPLTYRATGVGRIFARTGWDTNAMWMTFNAGVYNESHAHHDQGSFSLANNNFLAVTNNIYSNSGINQTSDYHNVLRFVNNGSTIPQREGTTSTMTVNQLNDSGVNVTANLTPAYGGNAAIQNWTRQVQFANRRLTITDQYTVSSGTQAIFQIQVPSQPNIGVSPITAGALRVRVISPTNAVVSVVARERYVIEIRDPSTATGPKTFVVELSDQ